MTFCYRSFFLILVIVACSVQSHAQGGTWTWMKGANTNQSNGNYGTKGVASASNEPPARYEACSWTDLQGNFWLFGGSFIGAGLTNGNDLWKYDVSTNMWTWMSGPNVVSAPNHAGVYGTKGIPSVNNYPSTRVLSANCWTDNNGDLWLYGGLNGKDELWKYHIATNEWTWVFGSGATSPVFGAKGTASASNNPGPIDEVKSAWVDAGNNLWMFGGEEPNTKSKMNTLWKYDISTGMWTWVSGSTLANAPGRYGTKGVETPTNEPPGRYSYTRWKDKQGDFFMFGGLTPNDGTKNDVWRYSLARNRWTWVSGTATTGDLGHYPTQKCNFSASNLPRARFENTSANDNCSKTFWMFGGFTRVYDSVLNDLWLFNTDSMSWAWISGSFTPGSAGSYGIQGVPSSTNMPPGRAGHSMWLDKNNNVWIFGGTPYDGFSTNDLWRFTLDKNCINSKIVFDIGLGYPKTQLCLGDSSELNIGTHTTVLYSPSIGVTPNNDSSKLIFKPTVTTSYQVVVKGGYCVPNDTLRFTITVSPRDSAHLKAPTPLALCKNDTAVMSVNPGWTISVLPNTAVSYLSAGGTSIKFFPTAPSIQYMVVATSNQACIYPDTIRFVITRDTVTEHIPIMTDTMLCPGDTATYTLNQKVDSWSVSPAGGFSVNKDTTVFKFFPPYSTAYRFVGIKNNGCRPKDTIYFNIHRSGLRAGFVLTPKVAPTNAARFTLSNTSIGANKYQWYVNGSAFSTQASPSYTATDSGRYCFVLLASDSLNCTDTAQDCADVVGEVSVYLPSAFSPNGDGINDVLFVRGRGIQTINLAIFNRWGQRVFESNDINKGWDGRYHGREQELDVYGYALKATFVDGSSISRTGNVSIIK